MQTTGIPPKFPVPFANAAVAGTNIRPIPLNPPAQPGAASLNIGFPPLNFTPVAAGGIPPFGQDMNGLLQQITAWLRWHEAGAPVGYDASFATSIGGYPKGSLLPSTTFHVWYESLIDNNTDDPNAGGANWRVAYSPWSSRYWTATGSANAQVLTLSPAPTTLSQLIGIPINFTSQGSNTGATTLNVNGFGNVAFTQANGTPLGSGSLAAGGAYTCVYNGARFVLTSQINSFADPNTAALAVTATSGSQGANLAFFGNGGTTPNKYVRAFNGSFEFLNSTYANVVMALTDAGVLSTALGITAGGPVNAAGNVIANQGRLRAGLGARGSGDPQAATILADFQASFADPGYQILPNGLILQWGLNAIACTLNQSEGGLSWIFGVTQVVFPIVFPSGVLTVLAQGQDAVGHLIFNANPNSWTTSGFQLIGHATTTLTMNAFWLAIGV